MRALRSSSTGMNETSTAPDSVASVASPEFGNRTYSTGMLSFLPSASAMSAVTPCGLPPASFTTKKTDIDGANTSATRSFPVGASSFMALSFALAAPRAAGPTIPHRSEFSRAASRFRARIIGGQRARITDIFGVAGQEIYSMKIRKSVRGYERWLRAQLKGELVEKDLESKHKLMARSAFPFLRATYWRWAETILDICPELADAPSVLAIGDIHIENYGSWRDAEGRVVWGVNDFDEAADMPYALDLVRLATSAVLAEVRGMREGAVCRNVLAGYRAGLARPRPFVLDRQHHWLREKVVVPEPDRKKFWTKYDPAKNKTRHRIPRAYRKALQTTLPSAC